VFAVGHRAAGYLTGHTVGKVLKVRPNLSLLLFASVRHDIDLLISIAEHRRSAPPHHPHHPFIPVTFLHGKKLLAS
jgi:hypothetical protein